MGSCMLIPMKHTGHSDSLHASVQKVCTIKIRFAVIRVAFGMMLKYYVFLPATADTLDTSLSETPGSLLIAKSLLI